MTVIDETKPGGVKTPSAIQTAAPTPGRNRITTIEPRRGLADLGFGEIWGYRDLLLTLAQRDVKLRYRQTALGVIWVVFQPLLAAFIFTIIFGVLGKKSFGSDGLPKFIFIFAGQMIWAAIGNTILRSSASLLGNSGLVSKIFFPRLILPLSTVAAVLIDFAISLVVLAILMIAYGIHLHLAILLMPFFLLLITFGACGVGLCAAALTVSYRDIAYIMPILLNLFMYASPINYSSDTLGQLPKYLQVAFAFNPVTVLVNGMRWTLLGSPAPSITSICVITVVSIVTFLAGAYLFRSMEKRFADII